MDDTARRQAVAMAETTERTLATTFGWATDEERLYRECPSAFWLGPDGGGVLPPPPLGPVMSQAVVTGAVRRVEVDGIFDAIRLASLAAGPIFAAVGALMLPPDIATKWWQPILLAVVSPLAAPLTVPVGGVLAVIPIFVGVLALCAASRSIRAFRTRIAWAAAGGVMGALIATHWNANGPAGIALIATSIACAVIARRAVTWSDADPA